MPDPHITMKWDDVSVFLAVYETGSAAAAARRLGVNQSTVSRRLVALEESLGVRLFDRVPEGLAPTDSAQEVLGHADAMREAAERFAAGLHNRDREIEGTVRVAVFTGIARSLIVPALPELLAKHPGLTLELVEGPGLRDLARREADLAIRLVRPQSGDLVYTRAASFGFGVYVSRRHAIDFEAPPPLEELKWLAWDESLRFLPESTWRQRAAPGAATVFTATDLGTLVAAVEAGLGAAVLPAMLARATPDLVEIHPGCVTELLQPVFVVCHAALRSLPRYDVVWHFLERLLVEAERATS